MNELDGRKLDHKTLEELRIRAVKRVAAVVKGLRDSGVDLQVK